MSKQEKPRNKYLKFTSTAFQMGATIYLGNLLGVWLDEKYLNQNELYSKIFTLLGVFIAIYMVIKQVINISKDD